MKAISVNVRPIDIERKPREILRFAQDDGILFLMKRALGPSANFAQPGARKGNSSVEHYFVCPYCGQEISMVLDLSAGRQTYVEDCEVCCKPIEISFEVEDGELTGFQARTLE